jgi:hypothetical protein
MNVNPIEWAQDLKQHRLSEEEVEALVEMFDENKLVGMMKDRLTEAEFVAFSKMFEDSRQDFVDALCGRPLSTYGGRQTKETIPTPKAEEEPEVTVRRKG